MNYEILYDTDSMTPWVVIEQDVYVHGGAYRVHSRHASEDIAILVKEALDARKAVDNG